MQAPSSHPHRQLRPPQPQPQMDSPDSDVLPNGYRRTELDRACALREAEQLTESQSSRVAMESLSVDRVPSMTARPRKKQRSVKDSAAACGDLLAEGYDPTKFVKQGVAIQVPKVGTGYRDGLTLAEEQWEDATAYFSVTSTGSEKPEVRVTLQFTSLKLAVNMHIQQKKLVDQFDSLLDGTTSGDLHQLAEQMRDNIVAFEGCGAEQCMLGGLRTVSVDDTDCWYLVFKEISSDHRNDEEFRSQFLSEESLSALVSILPDYYVRDYKKYLEDQQPACSICLVPKGQNDSFTFVMSCPQGHTLCSNCYKRCYQTADANSKDIECPTCKVKLPLRPFSRLSGVARHMFDVYVISERILQTEFNQFYHLAGRFLTTEYERIFNQLYAEQDGGTFGPQELEIMCDRLQFFTEINRDPLHEHGFEWLFEYSCVKFPHLRDEQNVTREKCTLKFCTKHPTRQDVTIVASECEVPVFLPFQKPALLCSKPVIRSTAAGERSYTNCKRNANCPFKMCRNCRYSCEPKYPPVVFSFRLSEGSVVYDLADPTIVKKNLQNRSSPQIFQMTTPQSY